MERSEFQVTVSKLSRTRELTSARLRDLTSEYQGIAEKAELELRRLESELIRMEEARDIAVAESLDKTRELRNFQKRYDTLKTIAESHREAAAAAKKQTDEMAAGHAKAMEMQTRRVAEARAAREAATAELDALRREHASLHDAFLRAGGVEHQLSLVRKASFAARTSALSSGGGSGGRTVTRNLLRVRNGWCVHAKPCGTAADASKLTPVPYEGQAGLEALIRSQGLYLCCTCLANGSFKIL
ncbi:hypothetical protein PLESTB_000827500 [Pleodorina starrii]|uniref:Uncharacterized protein n=1 Tax=Pleodorina starrii TaxID=330485 RepID=A0A9W6F2D9_9CHLO|nr:hypothetical protein PLESTB_000827500 [Pleodorina starrii]GLC64563.1 hypothetical protein PLESTF_000179100 [Pleodorina starrii]